MGNTDSILTVIQGSATLATEDLLPKVYNELRKMAQSKLAQDRCQSLSATGLVHEAYVKLIGKTESAESRWDSHGHFFGAAANAMRRILVDHARKRYSAKRGGSSMRLDIDIESLAGPSEETYDQRLLKLDAALDTFSQGHPVEAELVKLRFFSGLSMTDAAKIVGVPLRTAHRKWAYAKARIFQLMQNRTLSD